MTPEDREILMGWLAGCTVVCQRIAAEHREKNDTAAVEKVENELTRLSRIDAWLNSWPVVPPAMYRTVDCRVLIAGGGVTGPELGEPRVAVVDGGGCEVLVVGWLGKS